MSKDRKKIFFREVLVFLFLFFFMTGPGSSESYSASVTVPTVTTNSAGWITGTGATLNGTVNANNGSTTVTFQYGTTTAYGSTVTADQSPVTGSSDTAVSKAITGLTVNTTYHYRTVGENSAGTTYGNDITFTARNCRYAINPTSASGAAAGGSGSVGVTVDSGCYWPATSNASWITITSGSSGTGSGTVTYTYTANPNQATRTGTLTIAWQTFTLTQPQTFSDLDLSYKIELETSDSPLKITLSIDNNSNNSIKLFVPTFTGSQSGKVNLVYDVKSEGHSVTEQRAVTALSSLDVTQSVSVDSWTIDAAGDSKLVVTYYVLPFASIYPELIKGTASTPTNIYYGVYEFILLRPSRSSANISSAYIKHELPSGWIIATTYSQEGDQYNTSSLQYMYGGNQPAGLDQAETLFVWGDSSKVFVTRKQKSNIEFLFVGVDEPLPEEQHDVYDVVTKYFNSVWAVLPIDRRMQIRFKTVNANPRIWPSPWVVYDHPIFGEWYALGNLELNYQP